MRATGPSPLPPEVEDRQRALLRRNRRLATGLLIAMAALFATLKLVPLDTFAIRLLRAASEAAIVGALADWFAVTALFRHPLGIPIPHTAIVPRNKDRIGAGLGSFVARHFLDPALVGEKVRSLDPSGRLARRLAAPGTAEAVADRVVAVAPGMIRSLEDRELRAFFVRALGEQLQEAKVSAVLGRVLGVLIASGQYVGVLERLVDWGRDWLERNEHRIEEIVAEKSRWWVPRTVNQRIARAIVDGLHELLTELLDPASERHIRLTMAIEDLAERLRESPETQEEVEAMKRRVLDQPEVQAWLGSLWDEVRRITLDDLASPQSRTRAALVTAVRSFGETLAHDAGVRARIDEAASEAAVRVAARWRAEIGGFIADVVRSWDPKTVIDRLELAVGSDLQYVRISGTIVAALVGSCLFLLGEAIDGF